jgi:hypothetical protein
MLSPGVGSISTALPIFPFEKKHLLELALAGYLTLANNDLPFAHEPIKDASRRSRGSGRPLSLTVSPLRAFARHGGMKYSAVDGKTPQPSGFKGTHHLHYDSGGTTWLSMTVATM